MVRLMAAAVLATVLGLAAPASAQPGAPAPGSSDSNDITVRGKRERAQEIDRFVDALTPARMRGQIVRFGQPVCPAAFGLAPAQNLRIGARLRIVADAAGVPLDRAAGCKPNLFVIVADDKALLADRVRKALGDSRLKPIARLADPGPAIALHLEGELDSNGLLIGVKEEGDDGSGGYSQVEVFGSDRIRPGTSPTFLASVLIVEPAALDGLTVAQLADYAAMRLFARVDPVRVARSSAAAPTILSVLDAPIGSEVPITMTAWDLGFLKALYNSQGRSYSADQRKEMRGLMRRDLGAVPVPPAKKKDRS